MKQKSQVQTLHPSGRIPTSEVTVLVKAVEGVFRRLVRMLIGRISLKKLQQLIQVIFIEEVEASLLNRAPDKNPTLADTVLLTGLDMRTIKKTKEQISTGNPVYQEPGFLDSFMPMFKVLDLWVNNEAFIDLKTGKPRPLKIHGDGATFSRLVSLALPYRGLSSNQVLKRLELFDAVSVDSENGMVSLLRTNHVFITEAYSESLKLGFAAIENLMETVGHNLQCLSDDNTDPDQGGNIFPPINPQSLSQNRKAIGNYLKKSEEEAQS